MTANAWWDMIDANWTEIIAFCEEFLPMEDHQDSEGNDCDKTVRQQILDAYRTKDPVLAAFLNDAWFRSPENNETPIYGVLSFLFTEEPQWEPINFDE